MLQRGVIFCIVKTVVTLAILSVADRGTVFDDTKENPQQCQ
jgi:hypothetical protein